MAERYGMRVLAVTAFMASSMLVDGVGAAAGGPVEGVLGADLSHRSFRTWTIDLPDERWFAVSGGIGIPHAGGDAFAAAVVGTDLKIDTDGDGQLDRSVRATADDSGARTARVVLEGNRADDGAAFRYGVRLREQGGGWQWAPGGAMSGSVDTDAGAMKVQIIDRNGNGSFNDFGVDAMVVGRSTVATYLSRTVLVDDALYEVDVDASGSSIGLTPYVGATAKFDMTSDFETKARLLSAVVRSTDGSHSFDLGRHTGAVDVPAGRYEIISGRLGLGAQTVRVAPGRATPIDMAHGSVKTFAWGGPVEGEFNYLRNGDQVAFSPNAIWYYGAAGEEYLDWNPIGKSPQFEVVSKATGEVLEVLILPGSC
ncbi:MAG: hypothetical protein ACYTGR_03300 [Planctomycetota bacterium]